jgi:rSAM/selenodomain-associated transferase 1
MNMKEAVIVFIKNRQHGKVKTRLAATVGNDAALIIYKMLLKRTCEVVDKLPGDKYIFYSDSIEESDIFSNINCTKNVQQGIDLGERMLHAFSFLFRDAYDKVMIIGSDCPELSAQIIEEAFEKLNKNDVVIGPATDGGYYLLGLKNLNESFFKNIRWSTSLVLEQTLDVCLKQELSYFLLPVLSDIDEEKDWKNFLRRNKMFTTRKYAIIFVYNAYSDLFNTAAAYMHKIFSPKTYACSLCHLTHDNFGMKKEWRSFIEHLHVEKEFLHKNQFIRKYGHAQNSFPAVYYCINNELQLLISSEELNSTFALDDLKNLLRLKLATV